MSTNALPIAPTTSAQSAMLFLQMIHGMWSQHEEVYSSDIEKTSNELQMRDVPSCISSS